MRRKQDEMIARNHSIKASVTFGPDAWESYPPVADSRRGGEWWCANAGRQLRSLSSP